MSAHTDRAAAWIYSGIWGAVVRWFRVPADPPALPGTIPADARLLKPDLGLVRYQKLWFWIVLTLIDGALLIAWIAIAAANPMVGAILAVPFLIVAIIPDIVAYIAIHLRYDSTWYVLTDRAMRIRRGIWSIHEATITYENIQNVDVRQGPVERFFGISTLVVRTAGGGGESASAGTGVSGPHAGVLQGIADPKALRDLLMHRAAASRTTGLGDDRADPSSRATTSINAGPAWTPAHLAMLREIRDHAVALTMRS